MNYTVNSWSRVRLTLPQCRRRRRALMLKWGEKKLL